MSNTKCCVPGCKNSKGSLDTLHKFPNPAKYEALFNTWVQCVGGPVLELQNEYTWKYRRVCDLHFEGKSKCRNNRLSNIAVPTLRMPQVLAALPEQQQGEAAREDTQMKHNLEVLADLPPQQLGEAARQEQMTENLAIYAHASPAQAQAPVHNEPGKRFRLDDTESPRGEHIDSTRPTKCSYADTVQNELCVAITREGHHQLTEEQANSVKKFLECRILADIKDPTKNFSPRFRGKPIISDGALKLWCEDEASLKWLKEAIDSLPAETCSSSVVKRQSERTRWIRAALFLPDCDNTLEDTSLVLASQNRWALIHTWTVFTHSHQSDGTLFLMLGIPENIVPALLKQGRRLSHNLGSVYVRFYAEDGTHQDEPPGKNRESQQSAPELCPGTSGVQQGVAAPAATAAIPAPIDDTKSSSPAVPSHSSPKPVMMEEMSLNLVPTIGAWRDLVKQEVSPEEGSVDDGDPNFHNL